MRNNTVNQTFAGKYSSKILVEAYTKKGATDYNKIDWMVQPALNNTDYLTTELQNFDIASCMYGSYFSTVLGNTSYLLVNKYKAYYGFDSMASCWYPSIVAKFYYNYTSEKNGSICYP